MWGLAASGLLWDTALLRSENKADRDAAFLAGKIRKQEPFFYIRFGDGFLECLAGKRGGTRDGETYSLDLAIDLLWAWDTVLGAPNVFLGDWQSASFDAKSEFARYRDQWTGLIGKAKPSLLHFEALLLMRESRDLRCSNSCSRKL